MQFPEKDRARQINMWSNSASQANLQRVGSHDLLPLEVMSFRLHDADALYTNYTIPAEVER